MPEVVERSVVRDHYKEKPYIGYFRVLRGKHCEGGVRYFQGDIVHSKSDLTKHNQPPYSIKYELVTGPEDEAGAIPPLGHGHPITPGDPKNPVGVKKSSTVGFTREELSEATKDELISIANEEGLVFDAKMKKEDMISSLLGEGEKA